MTWLLLSLILLTYCSRSLSETAIKPSSSSITSIPSSDTTTTTIYLHIGPHKTGTTHIQTILTTFSSSLQSKGLCWPSNHTKHFHDLALTLYQNKSLLLLPTPTPTTTTTTALLLDRIQECFLHSPSIIISSETFDRFDIDAIVRLRSLFFTSNNNNRINRKLQFRVIAIARDYFLRLQSAYIEKAKRSYTALTSFAEFITTYYDSVKVDYGLDSLSRILQRFEQVFGRESLTIIDYKGVELAQKDIAEVILCEIIGLNCSLIPNIQTAFLQRENVAYHEKTAYDSLIALRTVAYFQNCSIHPSYDERPQSFDKIARLIHEYRYLVELLPMKSTSLLLWQDLSMKYRRDLDELYKDRIVYFTPPGVGNPLQKGVPLFLVDYDTLYANKTLIAILKKEVCTLIRRNVFIDCSLREGCV